MAPFAGEWPQEQPSACMYHGGDTLSGNCYIRYLTLFECFNQGREKLVVRVIGFKANYGVRTLAELNMNCTGTGVSPPFLQRECWERCPNQKKQNKKWDSL
jgi:hypothetical protein